MSFPLKRVNYRSDGTGRDSYVNFPLGSLPPSKGFDMQLASKTQTVTPRKDATAFDYKPDGTGRDTYIINLFGLKRSYKSQYRDFETSLRSHASTPYMDAAISSKLDHPKTYVNWPSQQTVRENMKSAQQQRQCLQRLVTPNRVCPVTKYQQGTATIRHDPRERTQNFLKSRNQSREAKDLNHKQNLKPNKHLIVRFSGSWQHEQQRFFANRAQSFATRLK